MRPGTRLEHVGFEEEYLKEFEDIWTLKVWQSLKEIFNRIRKEIQEDEALQIILSSLGEKVLRKYFSYSKERIIRSLFRNCYFTPIS